MKTINDNTQDISLHKASDNYAYEHAPNEYSIRFNSFRAGGNWQQQKDKITIEKLVDTLRMLLLSHYKLTGGLISNQVEKNAENILNQLKESE